MKSLIFTIFLSCSFFCGNWSANAQELTRSDFDTIGVVQKIDKAISILQGVKEEIKKVDTSKPKATPPKQEVPDASEVQKLIDKGDIFWCAPCRGWRFRDLIWRDGKWIKYVPGT